MSLITVEPENICSKRVQRKNGSSNYQLPPRQQLNLVQVLLESAAKLDFQQLNQLSITTKTVRKLLESMLDISKAKKNVGKLNLQPTSRDGIEQTRMSSALLRNGSFTFNEYFNLNFEKSAEKRHTKDADIKDVEKTCQEWMQKVDQVNYKNKELVQLEEDCIEFLRQQNFSMDDDESLVSCLERYLCQPSDNRAEPAKLEISLEMHSKIIRV